MSKNPKVSIIILTFNSKRYILNCLKSVEKSTYSNYEIIVVDNGSRDGTIDLVKNNFPELKVVLNKENLGFTGGNNLGIKNAQGDIILLLNDDTIIHQDLLKVLVKELMSSDKIGIVGPKIYYMDEPKKIWFAGGKIDWFKGRGYHLKSNKKQQVDFITGCALMIKREVINRIGLLDEKFFAYYEDADWCQKAKRAGYRVIYLPFGGVWHAKSATASNVFMDDIKGKYFKMLGRYLGFSIFLKWKNHRNRFVFFLRYANFKYKVAFLIKFIFILTPRFIWLITGQVIISLFKIAKKHV